MKKEPGMAYNTKVLNKVFALLSVLFLMSVIWMVLDDYIRPWKAIQIKALDIKREKLEEEIAKVDESIDAGEVAELEAKIEMANESIAAQSDRREELNNQLSVIQKRIYAQNMKNGVNASKASALQFKYEHAMTEGHYDRAGKYKKQMERYRKLETEGKDQLKAYQVQESQIKDEFKQMEADKTSLEKELDGLLTQKKLLLTGLKQTQIDPIWFVRNAPFLDYLDPTIKIEQVVVEKAVDDRYYQQVPKVDRCMTCHVFIDKAGFEDQANPYKTHPDVDILAVGINSHHPMKEFGCTACHGGEGHRVHDFNSPVHMPSSEEQKKEWIAKYNWKEPHYIPQPMIPTKYTEAMCLKCHQGVERVPMATKLNKGREMLEDYGCYACHKIEGWQHHEKPGPSLVKMAAKLEEQWVKNWIWSPHAFNPHSRMPAFFMQSNNSDSDSIIKNRAEVNAMTEYLFAKSKTYKPFSKYTGGSVDNGKKLVETVGCVGCHMVEGIDSKYDVVNQKKGPYLTGLGSKLDKDWLVSWLKKPAHYQEDTIMPSFRLTDKQANDIAAFLLSSKNQTFESLNFPSLNKKVRDEILIDYFSQFDPVSIAKENLAKLSDHERTMELGERSLGKYGCYSCHKIEGFKPNRAPIGPELTTEGSKPITQFGFGQQHDVPHDRIAWIWHHMKDPRRWDIGVPKPFKDLNLMPNFYLSDQEADFITMALIAQVSDPVPMKGRYNLSANEKIAEEGKKVANKYNCQGCHKIDGEGGHLSKALDDTGEGAPYLAEQGHRVHVDWFYNFLTNVHPIRPYVEVRMPSFNFSNEEVNKLVAYFKAAADQPIFEVPTDKVKWEPGERAAAKKLWDELACTSCHAAGFTKDEPLAPNLRYAKKRLRGSWMEKWLANPYQYMPYTTMPAFWGEGEDSALDGVLGDDPKRQRKALIKYIYEVGFDKDPAPFANQPENTRL